MKIDAYLQVLKRFGIKALFVEILNKCLGAIGIKKIERIFYTTKVDTVVGYEVKILAESDILEFIENKKISASNNDLIALKKNRALCIAAFQDNDLAGYCWYSVDEHKNDTESSSASGGMVSYHHSDNDYAIFDNQYMCAYNAFVNPSYRGKNVYQAIVVCALAVAQARGLAGVISAISWINFASLRATQKMSGKSVGISYKCRWLRQGIKSNVYYLAEQQPSIQSANQS